MHLSKLNLANTSSKSLRVTIPSEVVKYLDLKLSDIIEWEIFAHSGKHSARIRKMESNEQSK